MTHALVNFQIPVKDFKRAVKFYNFVMDYEMHVMEFGGAKLAMFQFDAGNGGVGGSLIEHKDFEPASNGTMVYLNCGDNLQPYLDRASASNAKIIVEKSELGPGMGYFAQIIDSEGNRVGLYSKK